MLVEQGETFGNEFELCHCKFDGTIDAAVELMSKGPNVIVSGIW